MKSERSKVSPLSRVKEWLARAAAAIEAAEEGPYGHIYRQVSILEKRVAQLVQDRTNRLR